MTVDSRLFDSLEWRNIGPHRGGRVVAVAGHPTEQGTFYFGAVAGGVWKTTNAGSHWKNISDGYFSTASVGAIAVSESDPNVIYVGTGETSIRSDVSHGDGVYRSTDGGRSWRNMGLRDTRHIGRIRIHPENPDLVYVAALGHAFGPNEERGVYRSKDGGETWERVLYKSERAGAQEIAFDGGNPRILYASIHQTRRAPWIIDSGGEDCGLWRSTDGGDTWDDISRRPGLPEGMLGKIGIATTAAQPGRVYALVEAEDGALFRSDDYGESWLRLSEQRPLLTRAWYYTHVFADPGDADTLWVLNRMCWKSIDGGATFFQVDTPHGDNHDLWIDPNNSLRMIEGNDGGACVSLDGGRSWSSILNQPTAQFYRVTTDDQVPFNVYGSQQDNWAMRLPSRSAKGAITWADYAEPGGGESGYIAVKPTPPYTVYGGGTGTGMGDGRLLAWNPETGQARNVSISQELYSRWATSWLKYRFQWTFPIEVSPHDPEVVHVCSQYLHRSTDEGASWEIISPDLTRNDPDKMTPGGGPITPEWGASDVYCTISAFRESPHQQGFFLVGTDDGLVHVSRDGGTSWMDITPPGLSEWSTINCIEPSPHDAGTVYIAAFRYMLDDNQPLLFKTTDYGETWTKITGGIPGDEFTRVIREDPERRGLLYAGTEVGMHVSFDDGLQWRPLQSASRTLPALPVVPVYDMTLKDGALVVATHGRGFWILDDLSPLRQFDQDLVSSAVHLFQSQPTMRYRYAARMFEGPLPGLNYLMTGPVTVAHEPVETPMGTTRLEFLDAGSNPAEGVVIHYWLEDEPAGEITLTILDDQGDEIDTFSSQSKTAPWVPTATGMNRFVWDLRYAAESGAPAMNPPRAVPGTYSARLDVSGETFTSEFEIVPDPRLPVTQEDLAAQRDLLLDIRSRLNEVHEMVRQVRSVKDQVQSWIDRDQTGNETRESGSALIEALTGIEEGLVNLDPFGRKRGPHPLNEKLTALSSMIDDSDHAPTAQGREAYESIAAEVASQRDRLDALIDQDLAAFNALVASNGWMPLDPL